MSSWWNQMPFQNLQLTKYLIKYYLKMCKMSCPLLVQQDDGMRLLKPNLAEHLILNWDHVISVQSHIPYLHERSSREFWHRITNWNQHIEYSYTGSHFYMIKQIIRLFPLFFGQYFYSFYTFTGVTKQSIHAFLQVIVSFSNFTNYTHNNRDI